MYPGRSLAFIAYSLLALQCLTLLFSLAPSARAAELPLAVSAPGPEIIDPYFSVLQETDKPLSFAEARDKYLADEAQRSKSAYLNFGLNAPPVWLFAHLHNASPQPLERVLSVNTSWLDHVDVYLLRDGQLLDSQQMGDQLPFAARPLASRYFAWPLTVPSGQSLLVLRIATPDPMVLPIALLKPDQLAEVATQEAYHYGFLYGVIIALMLYNLFLFLSLKSFANLLYSIYILSFILMNLAYSGHGYQWLWSNSPSLQKWSNPLFMTCYSLMGLGFAGRFLNLRVNAPRLLRWMQGYMKLVAGSLAIFIVLDSHPVVIFIAFLSVLLFTFGVFGLGFWAVLNRLTSARYFFAATLFGVAGACITCLTVWGLVPYHPLAYLAIDLGMMIEAVLLSLALADQFNIMSVKKDQAEMLARIDPLSGLYNRRAAEHLIKPIWESAKINDRLFSMILLDIDHFKKVNDSLGHLVGDRVIVQIAEVLKHSSRASDIAVRWGGEEFVIYLPDTSAQQASDLAERFRKLIQLQGYKHEGQQLEITSSFGVVQRKPEDIDINQLFLRADKALYQAKNQGRNRVVSLA